MSPASGEKKKRKSITLEGKVKIMAYHEDGKPSLHKLYERFNILL